MNNYNKNYNGFKDKHTKADWRICPRCNEKAINRELRKCMKCKGVVFFNGDDSAIDDAIENKIGWFLWHKSVFNMREGYYYMGYFNGINYDIRNVKDKPANYKI
jgi:hypothetical protein